MDELIKEAIRRDWEHEICNDWKSGMDTQSIAEKHSITVDEVNNVLIKHGL